MASEEVEKAVRELVVNKSCGIDCIYAEHMLYSSHVLFRLLGICMSSFLVHGFLPDEMMAVALVPIIKSKSGCVMSKDNYCPIALASIVSRVLEKNSTETSVYFPRYVLKLIWFQKEAYY